MKLSGKRISRWTGASAGDQVTQQMPEPCKNQGPGVAAAPRGEEPRPCQLPGGPRRGHGRSPADAARIKEVLTRNLAALVHSAARSHLATWPGKNQYGGSGPATPATGQGQERER